LIKFALSRASCCDECDEILFSARIVWSALSRDEILLRRLPQWRLLQALAKSK
jgi:hypothetical protein